MTQALDGALDPGGAEDAPDDPAPLHIVGANAQTILEQFRGSPLLAEGRLSLVGLDAIVERLGPRWALRRDLVYEHAERVLRRELGSQALVQRISETEYIVAQSDLPRAAGHARCLNCLREILNHFLGEALTPDLRVHEVTRITEQGVFGQRLDVSQVEAAEALERSKAGQEEAEPVSFDRWTPFTTSTGQRVGVSCSLEPVLHLRNSGQIGYRVAPRVQHQPGFGALTHREFQRLAPSDIEKIDFATIARALDRVRITAAENKPPTLIIPVSYTTLQSRRGRATIIALLRQARTFVVHGLICEITGMEGAPAGSLQEAVRAILPLCLHVVGRLAEPRIEDARHLVGIGLGGLSARAPRATDDAQLVNWVRTFVRSAGRVSKTLMLYQVNDLREARLVAELGVTHVTFAPQRLKVHFIDEEPL